MIYTRHIHDMISEPITVNSKLITYKLYNIISSNNYNINTIDDNNNKNDIDLHIINIDNINYNLFVCINKNGNVEPIKKWIIETTWNYYTDFV